MKLKPILLETTERSQIWSSRGNELYFNQNNPNDPDNETRYHIYLVDTKEEIKGGDLMIFDNIRLERHFLWKDSSECSKIVSMSYVHTTVDDIPQISEESIELLIEYYNLNGKMPNEVEVTFKRPKLVNSNFRSTTKPKEAYVSFPKEKLYTISEVESLIREFGHHINRKYNPLHPVVGEIEDWIKTIEK